MLMKSTVFLDVISCSSSKVNRRFGGKYGLHFQCLRIRVSRANTIRKTGGKQPPAFTLVSCSSYSSSLKMETICSSETSVDLQRTVQRYIPENSTHLKDWCHNLKSYNDSDNDVNTFPTIFSEVSRRMSNQKW
jgi:hypothetical protein